MSKTPPIRPGITFEVGARLEAQDYLQKWYPSKIEKIDYEEEKMLIHFERWSSRYDEWIHWDSSRIRPLERPALRKEGLRDEEEDIVCFQSPDFKEGEEVLARWTDCRYYPAKIEAINKEGTYTVQFYDGVIRCLKKMHIKSMPEDARGQDWIALVKAAAAVVKNKAANKPRTSVNSNKEEKKMQKGSSKKEEVVTSKPLELFHKEEEPTSSQNLEIALEEVPKLSLQQREDEALLKRKISQASSFQAKRARLNKITGLLASKAVVLDDAEKKQQATEKPAKQEEAIAPKPQNQIEADKCHSIMTVKPSLLPPTLSSGKFRSKKDKQESVDASGCKKSPSLSFTDPQLNQGMPHNANLSRSSGRNNQRRRSRRLTSETCGDVLRIPFSEAKGLLSYSQTPQDLSIAKVPDVAFVPQEKLEPLDLSRNVEITSPIIPASTFHIDCLTKEKEHLQLITYSPKAIADGKIASTSSVLESPPLSLHTTLTLSNNMKPPKASKKKKSPGLTSTDMMVTSTTPAAENKLSDSLQEKIIKKVNDKDKQPEIGAIKSEKKVKTEDKTSSAGKKKEKDKERKEKDHSKSKQKKKKKKKKKKHSDYEESTLDFLDRSSSPVIRSSPSVVGPNNTLTVKNTTFQFPCAILSVDLTGENLSDMEFLDDSSTESLILSGDEYNQEFDSTNFEESQDEEEGIGEIVRCVCKMDEENGFMIQCEECLCWQHSICMGVPEDNIPEQYICYVCSDPPGQRWSAKYKYDRDWFNNGRMCGLSFINDNYSYLNAKKIVSTHHLLADVYGVTEILHGLQLKFGILKNKDHPDLRLWSRPMKPRESNQGKGTCGLNHKGPTNKLDMTEETYIVSEHSYQKPQGSGGDNKMQNDTGKSEDNNSVILGGHKSNLHTEAKRRLSDHINMERRTDQAVLAEVCNDKKVAEEQLDTHLQWQLNLLTHIESVQNEVTSRMDLIEKEVDVLESWLDFTGELEPPDPLMRLPQIKKRIKQLLIDMGKVQQIATLCSV
ncbi:PHD finger protein 20-like protein 1 isoform X2 [Hyla sarda]|uniref:PHD finger protein 20-like protein 1 isoform X2 n=1 Tax=Hyla sarda TaxID=327740 RepID=UPI0024C40FA8|nr:PHD finger protein 20-like protein 1 isoform X2 [Hyla sarda]